MATSLDILEQLSGLAQGTASGPLRNLHYFSGQSDPWSVTLPTLRVFTASGSYYNSPHGYGLTPEKAAARLLTCLHDLSTGEYVAVLRDGEWRRVSWNGRQWRLETEKVR